MRVVAKFLAAFLVVSMACLTLYAYLMARRELTEIEKSVASDMSALAEGVREGMVVSWMHSGDRGADEVVRSLAARRPDLKLRFERGVPPLRETTSVVRHDDGTRTVSAAIPIEFERGAGGTLEVMRSIGGAGRILRAQLIDELMVAGFLVFGVGVVAAVLGTTLIGGPLRSIVAQARRIGEGDFSQRLDASGKDEIGALRRELNSMCDRLVEAIRRVEEESTARIETLEQLRHLDRLRTVGTLASSLAHELGTPLNVLLIRGQSLASGEIAGPEIGEAGKVVVSQVEKMSRIVRQLLDFSRQRGRASQTLRLSEIAERTKALLQSLARKNKVNIEVVVRADSEVTASPEQLEQAVTNLILNALQAMPQGGQLALEVRTDPAATPPGSSRAISVGVIDVRDQGIGITEDDLRRIFEPFYTTKPPGKGTGLGLTVAQGIAMEYGGWISAQSEVGKGSTFSLWLPTSASGEVGPMLGIATVTATNTAMATRRPS